MRRERGSPSVAVGISTARITVVTVTYGNRRALLEQVIAQVLREGVEHIVVIDNGARWDVSAISDHRISVVRFGRNVGSALGFARGMACAVDSGSEYIWLLDDDTVPVAGCLEVLVHAYKALRTEYASNMLAVLAWRPGHAGATSHAINRSSFLGFNVTDVPARIFRRLVGVRVNTTPAQELAVAPYGGLLFSRDLVRTHGLPNPDFVVGADDTEFTYRITRAGGTIRLVPSAKIRDLEVSWHLRGRSGGSLERWLFSRANARAYYAARNLAYFETHCRTNTTIMLSINRLVYETVLVLFALVTGRLSAYRTLRRAVSDGRSGRLGERNEFLLD